MNKRVFDADKNVISFYLSEKYKQVTIIQHKLISNSYFMCNHDMSALNGISYIFWHADLGFNYMCFDVCSLLNIESKTKPQAKPSCLKTLRIWAEVYIT